MPTDAAHDFQIRSATAADIPAVVEHVRRALAEFGMTFGIGSPTDAELYELPKSYVDHGGAFWIARLAGTDELVGCAGIIPVGRGDYELRKMYLSPLTRGKGLGGALLDLAFAFAREQGAKRIVLDTTEQMHAAIAFYEKRGFVRDDSQMRASRCSRGYSLAVG